MSRSADLHSYFAIIQKLQEHPYRTKKELVAHVEKTLERYREQTGKAEKGMSDRSFERDKQNIRNLLGVNIQCRKSDNTYFIAESGTQNRFLQQMADAFQTLQLLRLQEGLQALVQPEKHSPKDTQHFGLLLNAIRPRKQVSFTYHKFWDEAATHRIIEPYLLKEAAHRWYLIGKDIGGNQYIKHFALDRMSDLYETEASFTPPEDKSYEAIYDYTYGIDGPHNDKEQPQEIILSFEHYQGKYVKELPLHASQQELMNDGKEYRISLRLYITRDLVMKILSYGETVTVIQPKLLANEIQKELKRTLTNYRK